jgi:hypothetical protein
MIQQKPSGGLSTAVDLGHALADVRAGILGEIGTARVRRTESSSNVLQKCRKRLLGKRGLAEHPLCQAWSIGQFQIFRNVLAGGDVTDGE